MDLAQQWRLRVLMRALLDELQRLEWVDIDAEQTAPHDEVDYSFDLMPSDDGNPVVWDVDHPDEIDHGPVGPLCVECGNYGEACIC